MAWDDLIQSDATTLVGTDFSFVDADTIKDSKDGKRYRLQGIDAPELYHSGEKGVATQEVGAQTSMEEIVKLANDMGYINVVKTGAKDQYGRETVDLQDKAGRSFRRSLAAHGVVPIRPDFDAGGSLSSSKAFNELWRTKEDYVPNDFDLARNEIVQAIEDESNYDQLFKRAQSYSGQWQHAVEGFMEQGDNEETAKAKADNLYAKHVADIQYNDRRIDTGKSNSPFSTAWNTGMIGVTESMWGVANLLGEKTGLHIPGVTFSGDWNDPSSWGAEFTSSPLSQLGQAGVNRARTRIADQGSIITDYKDVDGFGTALEYITNNAAISLPYMAISLGGAALAPVTGGLSLAAPASVYTGQTWNEMEGEKSASVAIGSGVIQAALDRLGIGFIFKAGAAPKKLYKEAVDKLVQRGLTKEAAEKQVANATRLEIAGFAGDAAMVAARQLKAKAIFTDLAKRGLVGGVGEGVTEAMQESTAYLGATLGSDKEFDWEELAERAIAAAVAGTSLGTSFSIPGGLINTGAWADVAYRQAPAESKRLSDAGKYAEEERQEHGRVKSIEELTAETREEVSANGVGGATFQERVDADRLNKRNRTFGEKVTDVALATPSLWRGATRWIFTPEVVGQSRSARILRDMFGGGLQRTFSGSNYENAKHHRVSVYKNLVPFPEKAWAILNNGKKAGRRRRGEISDQVYSTIRSAIDPKTKKFNPKKIPRGTPNRDFIIQMANDMQRLSDKMWQDQRRFNPKLGRIDNYLARYKSFNKRAINSNKHGFKQSLRQQFGMTDAEATAITEAILNNAEINDIGEAFSVVKGGPIPGSHKKRSLNLAENEAFNEFMEKDIFANMSAAAKSAARYVSHNEYIGKNADVISKLLNNMQNEGVPANIVNKIANQLQDYFDAESGNYKRPTSEAGKAFQTVQRNFMMFTTLAGLPLATISSFVELALTMRGLTLNQIIGKDGKGGLSHMGKELGDTLWNGMSNVASLATRHAPDIPGAEGKDRLRDLGFYDWDVGAATTTGVTEVNPWQQNIYEMFFKATGLQGWTNYTRAVRAAMAGDYITSKLDIIKNQGDVKTNHVQEAEEALRNLGINIDDMLNLTEASIHGQLTPAQQATLDSNIREATFNFINDAVALPQSQNRPLIYQDPRFALFTQFQGFMATFTANHIPKLWGEYVKRGTPAMKYNAFGIMTTMIMLGFASQYLKDLLKYGGSTPYVHGPDYVQRGIRASGLLGTGERVLDQFFPIYETRSDDAGEWLFNETTSQSPALSNLTRLGKGFGGLLEGDVGKFAKNIGKSAPITGPFTGFNQFIGDKASSWNFKGDS